MKPGDRVFVDGAGAGHVVSMRTVRRWIDRRSLPFGYVTVELDTGRRVTVAADLVRPTT